MKKLNKSVLLILMGAIAGGIGGYVYWQQIGCSSGTCMITSKPVNSTIYFAVMGAIFMNMIVPLKKKTS